MQVTFSSVYEPSAGLKWQNIFHARWPAYRAWLRASGLAYNLHNSIAALHEYMPQMVDTHKHLCDLVKADELATSFLTGFQPPVYSSACSQAVSTKKSVQLVRNYDYHPSRFEGMLLSTNWNGKRVIANSDCLIGVLDGMNDDGLVVSLTFGGREVIGFGFGIPFILRYVLEFCSDVGEAIAALVRIPSHMSYNVTVTDKTGAIKTVQIAPDKATFVTDDAYATNHQGNIDWPENAEFNKTADRAVFLEKILAKGVTGANLTNAFLSPPLYNTTFLEGLGTLYTAVYRPNEGIVQLHWPDDSMFQSFDVFIEERKTIKYIQAETSVL